MTLQAIGTETGTWSSNPLMTVSSDVKPLMGSTTSPELIFKNTTPLSQMLLDTKIDKSVFNQQSFNSTDMHVTAGFSTQNAHWVASMQERTDYDTTRTSEVTNYGLRPVVLRHLGLSLTPQVTFNPTAVDSFALTGSAATSQYESAVFTNYKTFSATTSYTRRFDPRNAGIISLQAQRYQTGRTNAVEINSMGPNIGWQTTFSPRLTANASVGAQTSRQYDFGNPTSPWTWQYVFAGGFSFKGVQDTIDLKTERAQFAYGNGTEALQTSFSFAESHALNSSISLNGGANYLSSVYQATTRGALKNMIGGNAGASYHATECLDFTTSYRYRHEALTNTTKTAQDHAVTVGLAYRPNMWTLLQ